MNVLERIFLKFPYRRKDGFFFVRCRKTYVLNNSYKIYINLNNHNILFFLNQLNLLKTIKKKYKINF